MIPSTTQTSIETELLRIEEDSIYSAKSHFNACDRWSSYQYWLGIPSIALSVVAGATIPTHAKWIATIASVGAAVLTGLITFLKPSEKATQHKSSGDQYLAIRSEARIFREIKLSVCDSDQAAIESLETILAKRSELNTASHQPSRRDFETARAGIEQGEAKHVVDNSDSSK